MDKTFKLAEIVSLPVNEVGDENKQIEVTEMIPQVQRFTVAQKKQELINLDNRIAELEARKVEVQKDIDDAVSELNLDIK